MGTILADYGAQRRAFEALLAPDCGKRILFFHGQSGYGKTALLAACREQVPADMPCIPIQLRGDAVDVAEIFSRSVNPLGRERLSNFTRQLEDFEGVSSVQIKDNTQRGINNRLHVTLHTDSPAESKRRRVILTDAWFQDLQAFERPILVMMDVFEQATNEVAEWISGPFLARTSETPALRVLLAGQKIPKPHNIEWGHCCEAHQLRGVHEATHWLPVVEAMGRYVPPPLDTLSWLVGVCGALDGNPEGIVKMIQTLPRREMAA